MSRIQLSNPHLAMNPAYNQSQTPSDVPRNGPTTPQPGGQASNRTTGTPNGTATGPVDATSYQDPDVRFQESVKRDFTTRFSAVAQDPKKFGELLGRVYGSHDRKAAERIRQQTLRGDTSWLPDVRFVQRNTLRGGNGAYSAENNTIYLSRDLQSNPSLLARTFSEEAGHHIDSKIRATDTPGDEGEHFRRLLHGETLTRTQVEAIRSENDRGVIQVDGRSVEVEFFLKKARKKLKKLARKVTGGVSSLAKKAVGAVKGAVRGVTGAVQNVARAVTKPVQAVAAFAKKTVSGVGQIIRRGVSGVGRAIRQTVGGVGQMIRQAAGGVGRLVRSGFGFAKGLLRDGINFVGKSFRSLGGFVGKSFRSLGGFVGRTLQFAGHAFQSVLGKGLEVTRALFRTLGSPVLNAVQSLGRFGLGLVGRAFGVVGAAGSLIGGGMARVLSFPQTVLSGVLRLAGIRP